MCHHTTIYVSSYYYICVLILLYILSPGAELHQSKSADLYEKAVGYAEGYAAGLDQASLRPHTLVA
jgi:hypothetical protein